MRPEGFEPPSQEQRGLYWVWMEQVGRELEITKEAAHEGFKHLFLKKGLSTMTLHKIQYSDYMDQIQKWCLSHEIELPEPDNQLL